MGHKDEVLDPTHVVVGLSGGVDSAVAALLLQDAGFAVHAVALRTWRPADEVSTPTEPARQVAAQLRIPLVERDLQATFFERVVTPFLDAYAEGLTPNPCVFCNPTLKFAALLEQADALGARWIATGHYARVIQRENEANRLLRARASSKDQSYALYRLTQATLRRLRLPLGDLVSKDQVRDIARQHKLLNAEVEDSQDLCFALGTSYQALISQLRPDTLQSGPIVDESGHTLGEHQGLPLYTVGQRSGLGIAAPERLYVLRLDPTENTMVVGPRTSLGEQSCTIRQVTFIAGHPPESGDSPRFEAEARIRYRAAATRVSVEMSTEDTATVTFATPQCGVAPGQSLVLYRDEEVLGGGVIIENADTTNPVPYGA